MFFLANRPSSNSFTLLGRFFCFLNRSSEGKLQVDRLNLTVVNSISQGNFDCRNTCKHKVLSACNTYLTSSSHSSLLHSDSKWSTVYKPAIKHISISHSFNYTILISATLICPSTYWALSIKLMFALY